MMKFNVSLKVLYSATIWQPFILNHFSGQQYKSSLDNETNPFVEIICPTATKTITTLTTAQTTFSKWLTTFYNWPTQENADSRYYAMQFHVKSVETYKRREDGNSECYDWKHYDSKTMEDVMTSVGCQPTYWKSKLYKYSQ